MWALANGASGPSGLNALLHVLVVNNVDLGLGLMNFARFYPAIFPAKLKTLRKEAVKAEKLVEKVVTTGLLKKLKTVIRNLVLMNHRAKTHYLMLHSL